MRKACRALQSRGTSWSAAWSRPSTTRPWRRLTRSRGASQGRTGSATPPTRLTPPLRMITSAVTWRLQTASWKRRSSTMLPAPTPWSSTARGRRRPRTMVMVRRRLSARGHLSKIDVHRYCEKFSNIFPFPVEEQNCHFEPKKICEQCEKKSIQPLCDMQERLVCNYVPVESCSQEAKQYCHKVEKVVVEEVCDMKFDTQYL